MSTSNRHEIANSVMSLIHNRDERRLDAKKKTNKKHLTTRMFVQVLYCEYSH